MKQVVRKGLRLNDNNNNDDDEDDDDDNNNNNNNNNNNISKLNIALSTKQP
jgi:hypothetical protein